MELNYRHVGKGRPLIILHGLFGSSDNWMSIAKMLSGRFSVFLPDLRNHGNSPNSELWNYDVMAEDVAQLIQSHGLNNCSVIGHSLGGKIAMNLALKNPGFINKLIIVDIGPKDYPVRHRKILDGLLSINLSEVRRRQDADDQLANYVPEPAIRMFLLKNLNREGDHQFKWKINLDTINRKIENVGQAVAIGEIIEVPTLFIRGGKSDYILEEDIQEIRRIFKHVEIKTISDAGHWVHAEQPKAFLKLANDFLN